MVEWASGGCQPPFGKHKTRKENQNFTLYSLKTLASEFPLFSHLLEGPEARGSREQENIPPLQSIRKIHSVSGHRTHAASWLPFLKVNTHPQHWQE